MVGTGLAREKMDISWSDVKQIFLLNLIPNTVGDTLAVGPLITILKKQSPNAKVIVTASPKNAPLLEGLPDKLIIVNELQDIGGKSGKLRKLFRYLSLMRQCIKLLKNAKPDVCFVLLPNFAPAQLVPLLAGVPKRVGYTFKGSWFSWTLTHKTEFRGAFETGDYHKHFLESNLDLLRSVKVKVSDTDAVMHKIIGPDAKRWASAFLAKNGLAKKKLVAVQAGAKWASKQWPSERFSELVKRLTEKEDVRILLFGTVEEKNINDQIKIEGKTISVLGESLNNVAALLQKCCAAVGNDSGIMHLASAVGTTPVVLYGSTIPEQSAPKGPGGVVIVQGKKYESKPVLKGTDVDEGVSRMRDISVENVFQAVEKVVNSK